MANSEFVMPVVELLEDYEPTTALGRQAEDNPFTATVVALAATFDPESKRSKKGAKLVFPQLERGRVTAKFSRAAKAAGYSPRYDDKANEGGNAVIVAYLVKQIFRARKGVTVTHVGDAATATTKEYGPLTEADTALADAQADASESKELATV